MSEIGPAATLDSMRPQIRDLAVRHCKLNGCWRDFEDLVQEGLLAAWVELSRVPAPRGRGCCSISGCNRLHRAEGLCSPHYMRLKRHGDPLAGRFPVKPAPAPQAQPRMTAAPTPKSAWWRAKYAMIDYGRSTAMVPLGREVLAVLNKCRAEDLDPAAVSAEDLAARTGYDPWVCRLARVWSGTEHRCGGDIDNIES